MAETQVERRAASRVRVSAGITVRHMRRQLPGTARDISESGVFLTTEAAIEAGDDIELILQVPEGMKTRAGRWVAWQGKVVRVERAGGPGPAGIAAAIVNCEPVEIVE